jgi:hypothetical protein
MSSDAKEILDQSVDAQKSLRLLSRFEPAHLLFSLSDYVNLSFVTQTAQPKAGRYISPRSNALAR